VNSRFRWLVFVGAVAAIGTAVLILGEPESPVRPPQEVASVPVSPSPTGPLPPSRPVPASSFEASKASAGAKKEQRPAEQVQLCGGEWVKTTENGAVDEAALWTLDKVRSTGSSVLSALSSGPTDFERATALWLLGLKESAESAASTQTPSCDKEPCTEARFLGDSPAIQRLASAASATTDPRAYEMALQACSKQANRGTCALLSPRQWARLDPKNARPWFYLLAEAIEHKDNAARDEALYRIATSDRLEDGLATVPALIIDRAPTDDQALVGTAAVVVAAIGMSSAVAVPYQSVRSACAVDAGTDPNLWQTCLSVAEVLARSDTLLERSIGIDLGRRLGWPVERTDRLSGEFHRLQRAMADMSGKGDFRTAGCGDIRSVLDIVRRRATVGEVAAVRESMKEPMADAELVREGRELRQRRDEQENARREAAAGQAPGARAASAAEGSSPDRPVPASDEATKPAERN
jgi:hypothetical protein